MAGSALPSPVRSSPKYSSTTDVRPVPSALLLAVLLAGKFESASDSLYPNLRQTVVILTYHDVVQTRTANSEWFDCSVSELEGQLSAMERARVHFITLDQLYAYLAKGKKLPSRPMCITFADNYEGYYRYALPILRRHHVPSAQFVHTGFVGSPIGRPKLSWDQLKEIDRAGDVTIGSQTVTHPADLRTLSIARVDREMADSKRALEKHLGHPIRYLAYPNGKFNGPAEVNAQNNGYFLAFSEKTQPANLSPSLYAVNRYVHTKWRTALKRLLRGT
jgi:peptidoglycan/xylan/chitin deacetylase (PgdA/CDA1 family)